MSNPRAVTKGSLIKPEFLEELKANGASDCTLKSYRIAVETLKDLEKDPRELEKKDLVRWSSIIREKYAEGTQALYRTCVRKYLKWLYTRELDGDEYPDCIKWMKIGRCKKSLPKEILSHDEVKRTAEAAERQRDRAIIWVGYESGCRPGELLKLRIRDVSFDRYGTKVHVNGKTGERLIRLVESVPDLRLWLSMHPEKGDPDCWLWPSRKGGCLGHMGWKGNLEKCAKRAGIKKRIYPHLLRHSRATHLTAKGANEAQLREIFGWVKDSRMPSVYVHLSGRDTDSTILKLYGINVKPSANQLEFEVKECPFCSRRNSPNARFCLECNAPLDVIAIERVEEKLRSQDELTCKVVQRIIEKAPEIVEDVLKEKGIMQELQMLGETKSIQGSGLGYS